MSRVHYSQCPVCQSPAINPLLTVKDHSVSGEPFVIWQCGACSLRFTQDVPDEASIGPYYQSEAYISHSNSDKGLLNRLYQRVRKHTLQQKARLVMEGRQTKGRLLDVGAGIGAFVSVMNEQGWEVTGVEPVAAARQQALSVFGVKLEEPAVLQGLPSAHFDAITLWHVLEHVHRLHETMDLLHRLLRPNGRLYIAVPNYTALDADAYKNFWAAYDVPRHLYHFTPKAMEALARQQGFLVAGIKPMWFDAFYISLLSSKYYRGRTSWFGAGFTALRSNLTALANHNRCSSLIYVLQKS